MKEQDEARRITSGRLGLLLIIVGVVFAADSALELNMALRLWPLVLAVPALGLLGMYRQSGGRDTAFLVVGAYLGCFSLLALYCSFTSWSELKRLWPLFITFLGVVLLALFRFKSKTRVHLLTGLILVSLSIVFLVVAALGLRYWWTVLVLAGISILLSEKARR